MYALTTITPPEEEPLTSDRVKAHLAIGHTDLDAWITGAIQAARTLSESYTGRRWITQALRLTLADWPDCLDEWDALYDCDARIRVPVEPVSAIDAVKYLDGDGDEQTVDVSGYQTWLDHSPPLVAPSPLDYWPIAGYGYLGAVRVEFTAGYGDSPDDVPESAKTAMLLAIGNWYENRADQNALIATGLPPAARAILDLLWTGSQR